MKNRRVLVVDGYELCAAFNLQYNLNYDWYEFKRDVLDIDPITTDYCHFYLEDIEADIFSATTCVYAFLRDIYPDETELIIEF